MVFGYFFVNVSLIYPRALEVPELNEEDRPELKKTLSGGLFSLKLLHRSLITIEVFTIESLCKK